MILKKDAKLRPFFLYETEQGSGKFFCRSPYFSVQIGNIVIQIIVVVIDV